MIGNRGVNSHLLIRLLADVREQRVQCGVVVRPADGRRHGLHQMTDELSGDGGVLRQQLAQCADGGTRRVRVGVKEEGGLLLQKTRISL